MSTSLKLLVTNSSLALGNRTNPNTKELAQYVLTDKWILAQKLRIPKI